MNDWGRAVSLEVLSDGSAARGFESRQGLGRVRHVQTKYLFQERVPDGHVTILPVRGRNNPVDLFTKAVSGTFRGKFVRMLGFQH